MKLKGGASRLGGEHAPGKGGETVSTEVAPIGCTRDGCVCFREERAKRKAGKATEKRRVSSRDLLDEQSALRRESAEKEEVKLKGKTAVGFEVSERRKKVVKLGAPRWRRSAVHGTAMSVFVRSEPKERQGREHEVCLPSAG